MIKWTVGIWRGSCGGPHVTIGNPAAPRCTALSMAPALTRLAETEYR
jgi:hypothetical protein